MTSSFVGSHPQTANTTPVGLTAVTPTDRPKSVRNRCIIEVFDAVFWFDAFWIFLWV